MLILRKRFPNLKPAPKGEKENREYRRKVLQAGRISEEFRLDCWARAKDDFVWYSDTFLWTHNPKGYTLNPERQFILRDYQEELAGVLIGSIGTGNDIIVPKSRDMGGTWVPLGVLNWLWTFYESQTALLGSWKQDYVDKAGDPNCLFWRLEFLWRHCPAWLRPPVRAGVDRKMNTLTNPLNGSSLTGEATNANFGRASRPGIMMLDEFAAVDCADQIMSSTGEAAGTRWFISTFYGAYGAFYRTYKKLLKEMPQCVYSMHWSRHPEKRKGLYTSKQVAGKWVLELLDTDYVWPRKPDGSIDYKFTLDGKLRSVYRDWYEYKKAGSAQEVAQQLDMEPQEAGYQFIDATKCEEIANRQARAPVHRGDISFNDADPMNGEVTWRESRSGIVQLWTALTNDLKYIGLHDTAGGGDIAMGFGGAEGSNSVFSFYNVLTREKIAQITTAVTPPYKFARYVAAMGRFLAGPNGFALLNWENNGGPGGQFTQELVKELRYPRVWMDRDTRKIGATIGKLPGWHSSDDRKVELLESYRTGLLEDRIINRCRDAILECGEYVKLATQTYEHTKAMQTSDINSAGESHGDMVIADALAYLAMDDVPVEMPDADPEIPEDSFEGRRRAFILKQKQRTSRGRW